VLKAESNALFSSAVNTLIGARIGPPAIPIDSHQYLLPHFGMPGD
jgi:hypothetical protein